MSISDRIRLELIDLRFRYEIRRSDTFEEKVEAFKRYDNRISEIIPSHKHTYSNQGWTSTDTGGPYDLGSVLDENGDTIGFETPWSRGLNDCGSDDG